MPILQVLPILALIAGLQAKHFVCDGPLQTKAMVNSKSKYGDGQGVLHAAIHAIGTIIVLFVAGFSGGLIVGLAILDAAVHYHVDFIKENVVKRFGWTSHDAKFWWALSADQMMHQFTYLGIAALAFIA
jgi:hypothetical protein